MDWGAKTRGTTAKPLFLAAHGPKHNLLTALLQGSKTQERFLNSQSLLLGALHAGPAKLK